MANFLYNAGLWCIVIVACVIVLIMLSFFIFGGRIRWSIELYGPLRFLSKKDDADTKESIR